MTEGASERFELDVDLERLPSWLHLASAAVVVCGALAALRVVPMVVLLPFLVASSAGRRFDAVRARVVAMADAFEVDGLRTPLAELRDVWLDDDETVPRVVVVDGRRVRVLRMRDRGDARRLYEAMALDGGRDGREVVAGVRPRIVDSLVSLRFVAISAAFVATGSRTGLLVLVFFGLSAWSLVRTRQLVVKREGFELRGLFSTETHAHAEVAGVRVDDGIVQLTDGREISIPRASLRDAAMAPAAWLVRARTRALEAIAEQAGMTAGSAG